VVPLLVVSAPVTGGTFGPHVGTFDPSAWRLPLRTVAPMTSILDETGDASPPDSASSTPAADDGRRLEELADDVERYRLSRDSWTILALGFAFLTALAGLIAVGLAMRHDDGGAAAIAGQPISAELSEFAIDLSSTEVSTAGVLTLHNGGTMVHNVGIRGTEILSADLAAGETAELDLSELAPGTYEVYCEISGHSDSGMTTTLTIGGGAAGGDAATSHAGHEMTTEEAAAMDATMMESIAAFPAETEGRGTCRSNPTCCPTARSGSSSPRASSTGR
jgi:plastocyanin